MNHKMVQGYAPKYAHGMPNGTLGDQGSGIFLGMTAVDEDSRLVLDDSGSTIAGLYAAGRTAAGIPSQTYVSGLSFADCLFSGRRAARHMAQNEEGG